MTSKHPPLLCVHTPRQLWHADAVPLPAYGFPAAASSSVYGTPEPLENGGGYASVSALQRESSAKSTHVRLNESAYAMPPPENHAASGSVVYDLSAPEQARCEDRGKAREAYGKVLGKANREALTAWLESPAPSKQAAELALRDAGGGPGSFCIRQGSGGILVGLHPSLVPVGFFYPVQRASQVLKTPLVAFRCIWRSAH